jgi:SAM-dependent methyltransferase
MPDYPHSYVVRNKTLNDPDFLRAVRAIRTFGEPGKFFSRTNIYLIDPATDTRWWTMGGGLEETIIINKAPASQTFGDQDAPRTASGLFAIYDELATDYDARYDTPECRAENEQIMRLIRQSLGPIAPRTLDVGCGTGLVMDYKITHPKLYTGVDPSQAMLNELVRKHTAVTDLHPVPWEQFSTAGAMSGAGYDLVVSLFGSPSYIEPAHLPRLAAMAERLVVLMHYREGYLPDYYEDRWPRPPHVNSSRETAAALPGARTFLMNNFQVTVIER